VITHDGYMSRPLAPPSVCGVVEDLGARGVMQSEGLSDSHTNQCAIEGELRSAFLTGLCFLFSCLFHSCSEDLLPKIRWIQGVCIFHRAKSFVIQWEGHSHKYTSFQSTQKQSNSTWIPREESKSNTGRVPSPSPFRAFYALT